MDTLKKGGEKEGLGIRVFFGISLVFFGMGDL